MSADTVDPRWLTHSVFKCPPAENRKTWAYITSGMSNPWEAESPEEYSGLGVEFLMEANTEAIWAPGSRYFCRKIFSSFPAGKNRQKLRDRLCLRRPDSSASPRSDPAWGRNLGSRMT
nr:suppressor of fused domain protein [Methylomonas sp. ZR1]